MVDCKSEESNPWRQYVANRPRHDLEVWMLAKEFTLQVYEVCTGFPDHEKFGMMSQLRRSANGVQSNIAEGAAGGTKKNFRRFLYQARGSLEETDSHLEIAGDLGYLESSDLKQVAETFEQLSRALEGLIQHLNRQIADD